MPQLLIESDMIVRLTGVSKEDDQWIWAGKSGFGIYEDGGFVEPIVITVQKVFEQYDDGTCFLEGEVLEDNHSVGWFMFEQTDVAQPPKYIGVQEDARVDWILEHGMKPLAWETDNPDDTRERFYWSKGMPVYFTHVFARPVLQAVT